MMEIAIIIIITYKRLLINIVISPKGLNIRSPVRLKRTRERESRKTSDVHHLLRGS